MPIKEDRWFTAWQKIQQRCAASSTEFDYTLLYPSRVVEWEESGINPSGLVGVVFISEPAASKIVSKKGVPVLPPVVGQRYVPLVGSQVLVGWQDGDERYPYATGWAGQGGADTVAHAFSTSYSFEGPLVDVVGDLQYQHLRLGGSSARPTVTVNPTYSTVISGLSIAGSDAFFKISFTFTPAGPITSLDPGFPILFLTWKKVYQQAPIFFGGTQLTLLSTSTTGGVVTPVATISGGSVSDAILTADPG